MTDQDNSSRSHSPAVLAALAVALLAGVGSLIWNYTLGNKLTTQQSELAEANQKNTQLAAQLRETNAKLRVTTDELSHSLGITQKQMDARAQQIVVQEEAANKRLEAAQEQTAQQVSAVQTDVSSVKTDVGGVKTDVAKTQTDLAGAVSQLQSIKGDLSDHSSLIARNHDELEILKHKGDRSYFEFTINKDDKQRVGTVTIELKKADSKKSRFTLVVYADDKKYEKKDKNVNEPLQFYSGKEPGLYEIVVNTINNKNQIAGYLSTPKSAAAPSGM
jgi:DNA anti-recombination protein RmuC